MARALIQINASTATSANVAIGSTVQLSNDDEGGELTYAWSIVDQPEGTADTLSSASIENPTFVPTKEGSYSIRLIVNASLGTQSIATAIVAVLDARTGQRFPAATETIEVSTTKGWARDTNRIFRQALVDAADGNIQVAQTPGGIAAGQVVKLTGLSVINAGSQSQFDALQIVAVNGTVTVIGRVGLVIDGVTAGDLGVNKLVKIRMFGLVPFVGVGSPAVGDPVYLSNAGLPALAPGTVSRTIGLVIASSGGTFRWVIDGVDASTPSVFTTSTPGLVPASGAAGNLLRGDAGWDTPTQVTADLDTVTTAAKGLAPASGAASRYLSGDPAWKTFAEVTADLDTLTTALKGLAPASGSAANYLRGDPAWRTPTQVTADLDVFTAGAKGLVPASSGGTTTFLRADGSFTAAGARNIDLGDGSDGAFVMDGTTAVTGWTLTNPGASGIYTQNRSTFPSSIAVSAGITARPDGWPTFCAGNCHNDGTWAADGGNAAGSTVGAAAWVGARVLPGGQQGGASGTNGGNSAGNSPSSMSDTAAAGGTGGASPTVGGNGGAGHGGGGGGGGGVAAQNGGTGGPLVRQTASSGDWREPQQLNTARNNLAAVLTSGSPGGGGGNGSGGAVGGAGGGSAGWAYLVAASFSGSGTYTSKGGNGGNGAAGLTTFGGGGGGGGAGGGVFVIKSATGTTPTPVMTGGSAGSGGAGGPGPPTPGVAGANGGTGGDGVVSRS